MMNYPAKWVLAAPPIREALNRLVEQGVIEFTPNRGFKIKKFTKKEMRDILILREGIELIAVELTIKNFKKEMVQDLKRNIESYPNLMKQYDLLNLNNADEYFHDRIAFFSENDFLYETLKNLSLKIRIIRRYEHLRPTSPEEMYQEHKHILECIQKKDLKAAKTAMADHIRSTRNALETLPNIFSD